MNSRRLCKAKKRRRQVFLNKFYMLMASLILIAGFSCAFGSDYAKAQDFSKELPQVKVYKSIEIKPGDTLWKIAKENMDVHYDSIYEYIDEIKNINGLNSDTIHDSGYLTIAYYDEL